MSYREIPEDKILRFPVTPAFKGRKDFFTSSSTTHPAKMNLRLLSWILEAFTKPGEIVLDPMAGTGSTIVLAALMGRHAIAVEYEPRFCEMIRENIKRTERQTTLTPKGRMTCIQGDARELSKLLEESDAIITSPPFGPSSRGGGIFREGYRAPGEEEVSDPGLPERHSRPLSDDPRNIDNLEYGEVDAVVTSPPYEGSVPAYDEGWLEEHWDDESDSPKHKTMRFGRSMRGYPKKVDTVVTSPPYGNRLADDVVQDGDEARMSYRQAIDSIVTSPPYEGSETETGGDKGKRGGDSKLRAKKDYKEVSEDNIGSMKGETYLEAMLTVYRECHKVLKPEGVMALVTKNFIRDKAVVRLDLDTIKLCEAAGFTLRDRWYFKLTTRSFWRILYRRKYPDVPEVEYEDVLVFKKEGDIPDKKVREVKS